MLCYFSYEEIGRMTELIPLLIFFILLIVTLYLDYHQKIRKT